MNHFNIKTAFVSKCGKTVNFITREQMKYALVGNVGSSDIYFGESVLIYECNIRLIIGKKFINTGCDIIQFTY